MSNQIILNSADLDNLPAALRQAIEDAKAIEPRVNGRYAGAIDRIIRSSATLNSDGTVDVLSRSEGHHVHHVGNGIPCDCQDARFHAPVIAGKPACVHQVVAWIVTKAARIAAETAKPVEVAAQAQPDANARSCWHCGSTSLADAALRGQPGHCHYCGSQTLVVAAQAQPAEPAPTPEPAVNEHMTIAQIMAAARKVNGNVAYVLAPTYIGGHGYAQILQAETDPQAHEFYLICGDWHEDELFVSQWGDRWGQVDQAAMQQLSAGLAPKPAATVTAMKPVVAYYLETSAAGLKVMCTNGQALPKCVTIIDNIPDRNERAAALVSDRASRLVSSYRSASPGAEVELRRALLPAQWRNRMGGDQIGKAWVVYAQQPLRNAA